MVDPYLAALARAAEAGTPCPAVWMTLDSGDNVTGTPHPSREFVDETFQILKAAHLPPEAGEGYLAHAGVSVAAATRIKFNVKEPQGAATIRAAIAEVHRPHGGGVGNPLGPDADQSRRHALVGRYPTNIQQARALTLQRSNLAPPSSRHSRIARQHVALGEQNQGSVSQR